MYPALIKKYIPRTTAFQLTKASRASVQTKAHTIKAHEEFYLTTAFPDDFESRGLKPEDLLKPTQAKEEAPAVVDKATSEKHFADIYESIMPRGPMAKMKKPDRNAVKEVEQEPGLDEM